MLGLYRVYVDCLATSHTAHVRNTHDLALTVSPSDELEQVRCECVVRAVGFNLVESAAIVLAEPLVARDVGNFGAEA